MQWCLHGAKGYRRRGPTAWLCCWSAEPVFFWPAGSSGPKRFSPPLQGLTPGLGITTKEKSNIRPEHTLLTSAWQKLLKISKCWFSFFSLNKPFAKCVKQHTVWGRVSWLSWLPLWAPQVAADPGSEACLDFVCDSGGNGRNLKRCFSEGTGPDQEWGPRSTSLQAEQMTPLKNIHQ